MPDRKNTSSTRWKSILLAILALGVGGALVAAVGCLHAKDGASTSSGATLSPPKPGWTTPITSESLGVPPEALHFEGAPDSMEGLSLGRIVSDPDVQVREDASCTECHDWAETASRESFCARIDEFMKTDQCGEGPKPEALKDILLDWYNRGCPD